MSSEPTDQRSALHEIATKWWTPDPAIVSKLPRGGNGQPTTCRLCKGYHKPGAIHLDFVGHSDLTRTLIEIDPEWDWEPLAFGEDGLPRIMRRGKQDVLWGRLFLLGKPRLGVGTCDSDKTDVDKELVGDFLRNAAMRFGIFGALWSKTDGWQDDDATTAAEVPSSATAGPQGGGESSSVSRFDSVPPPPAFSQPDKPLAAMTMRELLAFATENAVSVSGSKSDIVRTLEPLVRAASGEEPFELDGAEPLPAKEDVTDKPFTPTVADELRDRPAAVRASIRSGGAE